MGVKYSFSGYEMAVATYTGLMRARKLPRPPTGKVFDWTISLVDPTNRETAEITFFLKDREPEPPKPEPKEYEAGDWKDPDINYE